ncbi:MAG: CoA transferase [Ilumatobacteraceae bacterium]
MIYARMSGYGHDGPDADYRSYGPVVQAVSGLSFISGLPGREPSGWGFSYMDNQASYYNAAALLMAIFHRQRTGVGTLIDTSAVEIGIGLVGSLMLDVSVNQRQTRTPGFPTGNRLEYPDAAPHGVYRCTGDDKWVAIAIFDDDSWGRLVSAMGDPPWAQDPRFATATQRRGLQDELDSRLERWTREHDRYEIMELLQARGIAAGVVQNAQDVNERDPQLRERGIFFELDHPVAGRARFEGLPMRFSETVVDHWRSAPMLGEDNDFVFGEVLGLSHEEMADLAASGVI